MRNKSEIYRKLQILAKLYSSWIQNNNQETYEKIQQLKREITIDIKP